MKPQDCENMDEVRAQIDRLDGALVDLLAERWGYVDRAWQLKSDPSEATVPWRIQEVIDKVKARSGERGMPPSLAEALWRQIIGWGIQHEEQRMRERGKRT
jgi:isochorismate pyruvate lyase